MAENYPPENKLLELALGCHSTLKKHSVEVNDRNNPGESETDQAASERSGFRRNWVRLAVVGID